MEAVLIFIFWVAVAATVYTYLGFPLLLFALGRGRRPVVPEREDRPPVTIVCSVFNEEKVIGDKIRNFYALDYPSVRMLIGLDGCTDGTMEAIGRALRDDRVEVVSFPRSGKVHVLNALMERVATEHVVMTDANSMFAPDAVDRLVRRMTGRVGVVCGRLVLVDRGGRSGEGMYWRLETAIKGMESRWGAVIGANGAIYLVRRSLVERLPAETINDDFTISMKVFEKGYDSVYAADAVAREEITTTDADEFRRHVRDSAGHYRAVACLWRLLNPLRFRRFFFYASHRLLRWLVPFFIAGAFFASLALSGSPFFRAAAALQAAGFAAAAVVHASGVRWKAVYVPYYFLLLNAAMFTGFLKNLCGLQRVTWDPTKR